MIVDKFLDLLFGALSSILQLIPIVPVPNFTGAAAEFGQVLSDAAVMGAWIPLGLVVQLAATLLFCMTGGLAMKVGRVVLSLFSGGGGGAG